MKYRFGLILLLFQFTAFAQQDLDNLMETARTFQRDGDYANALLVLNKAKEQHPDNKDISKELAYTYYLQRDYANAKKVIQPLLDREDADIVTYQIGGNIYKATEELKTCEKLYRKGLKKYPNSGALLSEYGEVLMVRRQPIDAIQTWEKGIEMDPSHPACYYQACRYYFTTKDKVWSLVYGEIFVNLESYTQRTDEIRSLLLKAYNMYFAPEDNSRKIDRRKPNDFEKAFLATLDKQSQLTTRGITIDNLVMIRTRFILDWFQANAAKFPFRLFEYQQQLLKAGMFEAYNQWLFGQVNEPSRYQIWVNTHPDQFNQFNYFQHNRVFKMPAGQYYQARP